MPRNPRTTFLGLWSFVDRGMALLIVVAGLLGGCAAGPATKALDEESVASLLTYREGAEASVAALQTAYREASLRELRLLAELDTAEQARDGVLSPSTSLTILDEYLAARARLDTELARFAAAWTENRRNIEDALVLRAKLREWLERGGVETEDVEALVEGIAGAVEGRRR